MSLKGLIFCGHFKAMFELSQKKSLYTSIDRKILKIHHILSLNHCFSILILTGFIKEFLLKTFNWILHVVGRILSFHVKKQLTATGIIIISQDT